MSDSGKDANGPSFEVKSKGVMPLNREPSQPPSIVR